MGSVMHDYSHTRSILEHRRQSAFRLLSSRYLSCCLYLCCGLVLSSFNAQAKPPCENWMGKVIAVQGLLEKSTASDSWTRLQPNAYLCPGDTLRSGVYSRASVYLSNNTYMRLNQNSVLHFPEQENEANFWVQLQQGIAHFLSRIVNRFEVTTPSVNAMVEGTEFVVDAAGSVTVIEGQVLTSSKNTKRVTIQGEQTRQTQAGQPLQTIQINSQQSVSWAVHYPPILTLTELEALTNSATIQQQLHEAETLALRGRPDIALKSFTPENSRQIQNQPPTLQLAQAALLLSTGQISQAESLLQPLLSDENLGYLATALQAVLEVVRNQPEKALVAAQKSVATRPESAVALLALSYAQQANIQLEAAVNSALQATDIDPGNILGWTRLAELQLANGHYTEAKQAVEHARSIQSDHPRALLMMGFVALFELDLTTAEQQFTKAIEADSNNPDAWLGLGLAQLRDGKLETGRQSLEIAVSLAPTHSLLRSYLGRAYFEEKREIDANEQWLLALDFDSKDPTPPFYLGVNQLFINDPLRAIESLERSRKLNNNRALYRSDALLQSDAATRSATLARAYDEAGFEEAVLLEGGKALSQDSISADGHRLLADRYASSPRHEAGRVSELLQAQLMQPLSAYPLQPQLVEPGLPVIEGLGPARPGLNEYHSLFSQDGFYGLLSGFAGTDDSLADEAVVSLLEGPISLSLGQYHYETDSFRENADQKQDVLNGFLQWQLNPSTNVQLEVRDFKQERGDLGLSAIRENLDFERKLKTYRIGVFSRLTSNSGLMVSAISQKLEDSSSLLFLPDIKDIGTFEEDPWIVEAKYIGQRNMLQYETGAGQYSADVKNDSALYAVFEGIDFLIPDTENHIKSDKTHQNLYTYLGLNLNEWWRIETGLAFDKLKQTGEEDAKQWSPKLGVVWNEGNWTIRSAAFRTFKRDLAANQTIEKSQVAGFNQFYADLNGADSKNYAMALDYRPNNQTHTGMEFLYRDIDFPGLDINTLEFTTFEMSQQFGSIYFSRWLTDQTSLRVAYEYDDNDLDYVTEQNSFNQIARAKTQVVPITLSHFLNQYITASYTASYVNQKNTLALIDPLSFEVFESRYREEAWIFDLSLQAKLPKRYGVFEVGAKNLFDREVEIVDQTETLLRFYPKQFLYARLQLNF